MILGLRAAVAHVFTTGFGMPGYCMAEKIKLTFVFRFESHVGALVYQQRLPNVQCVYATKVRRINPTRLSIRPSLRNIETSRIPPEYSP